MTRKAQSALISYALYVAIGISAVTMAVSAGQPYLDSAEDTAAVQNQMRTFNSLTEQIETVATMAQGTQTTGTVQIDQGRLTIRNGSLVYRLQTDAGIITPGARRQIGDLTLSANARASLTQTTHNGTECYRLANRHIETCIATRGTDTTFEQGTVEDLLLYIHNRRQNVTMHPDLSVIPDHNDTTTDGRIRTTPLTQGRNIGTAHLAVLVAPDNRPTYTINIELRSGSDFLQVSVE